MITFNVLERVFNVKYKAFTGTCLAIDVNGKQYIVTANHVVEGISSGDQLEILHDRQWRKINCQVIGNGPGDIDIVVLAADIQLAHHELILKPNMSGITLGHDVYFLGFPYDLSGDYKKKQY